MEPLVSGLTLRGGGGEYVWGRFVDKVKNEKMRMYLGNHWNDEFHNSLQHADNITLQTDQDRTETSQKKVELDS